MRIVGKSTGTSQASMLGSQQPDSRSPRRAGRPTAEVTFPARRVVCSTSSNSPAGWNAEPSSVPARREGWKTRRSVGARAMIRPEMSDVAVGKWTARTEPEPRPARAPRVATKARRPAALADGFVASTAHSAVSSSQPTRRRREVASPKNEWVGWRAVLAARERLITAPPSTFSSTRFRDAQGTNPSRPRRPVTWQSGKVR